MFASIPSAVLFGARGHRVTVEVHVAKGLAGSHVVGLPDESIRELRDRVRAAVMSAGVPWPDTKVTVNLAPFPQRKSGSGLDLANAVGVMAASGRLLLLNRRPGRRRFDARPRPVGDKSMALDLCRGEPQHVESVARSERWDLARAAMALARLERAGWVAESGGWFERVDAYGDLV